MVPHEAVRVEGPRVPPGDAPQLKQEQLSVAVVGEDGTLVVPARGDVVIAVRNLDSRNVCQVANLEHESVQALPWFVSWHNVVPGL